MGSSRAHGYRLTDDDLNMTVSQCSALSTKKQTVQKLGFYSEPTTEKRSTAGILNKVVYRAAEKTKIPRRILFLLHVIGHHPSLPRFLVKNKTKTETQITVTCHLFKLQIKLKRTFLSSITAYSCCLHCIRAFSNK